MLSCDCVAKPARLAPVARVYIAPPRLPAPSASSCQASQARGKLVNRRWYSTIREIPRCDDGGAMLRWWEDREVARRIRSRRPRPAPYNKQVPPETPRILLRLTWDATTGVWKEDPASLARACPPFGYVLGP